MAGLDYYPYHWSIPNSFQSQATAIKVKVIRSMNQSGHCLVFRNGSMDVFKYQTKVTYRSWSWWWWWRTSTSLKVIHTTFIASNVASSTTVAICCTVLVVSRISAPTFTSVLSTSISVISVLTLTFALIYASVITWNSEWKSSIWSSVSETSKILWIWWLLWLFMTMWETKQVKWVWWF